MPEIIFNCCLFGLSIIVLPLLDIIKILESPSIESILEDDIWSYVENGKSKSALLKLGKNVVLVNNVLVLELDNKGILKNKKFNNINDPK